MNRSLRELKMIFFIIFPLICAFRLAERIDTLIVAPISAQHRMFGKVVAYPWALRRAETVINRDFDRFDDWTFAAAEIPKPVAACQFEAGRAGGQDLPGCRISGDIAGYRAAWGKSELRIQRSIVTSRRD